MGSTGFAYIHRDRHAILNANYGIRGGRVYDGIVPKEANFTPHSSKDIQLRLSVGRDKDIIFQFRLGRNDKMSITAFDPITKQRVHTQVNASRPSIDDTIKTAKNAFEKTSAIQVKEMFHRSATAVKETQLSNIAAELKKRKANK